MLGGCAGTILREEICSLAPSGSFSRGNFVSLVDLKYYLCAYYIKKDMDINARKGEYDRYIVEQDDTLLNWLLEHVKHLSRTKLKATLAGRGIIVEGKRITQFDYPLHPGMKIAVSRTKRNDAFKSRYVKIVYEDRYLVVVEKNVGI